MSYCGNIDPTCDVCFTTSLTDCDDLTLATGFADGSYYFTIIDKFGKGHTNQYAVVGGNVTLLMSNYGGSFFNKYSGVYEIFAHTIINIFTRLTLTINAVEYTSILFTMNSNCCSGVPYVPPTPITDDVTLTINSATFDTIDCSTLYDVVVKDTDGFLVGEKIGDEWIVTSAISNLVEINLVFEVGADIEWTLTTETEQAAYYTSIDLTNFDSYTITVDAVPVSFPFTLAVGEILAFTGVLTNVLNEGLVTFNGVYDNPLVQNDYVITIFNPSNIAGLQLWLDATDEATITKDGSNYVSAWLDKSINGYSFNQGSAASQPKWFASGFGTESKPYLSFDGINDWLLSSGVIASNTNFTAFHVWKKTSGNMVGLGMGSQNKYTVLDYSSNVYFIRNDGGYDSVGGGGTNTVIVTSVNNGGSDMNFYKNNVFLDSNYSSNISTTGWDRLGVFSGSTYAYGFIAETIYYNRALTTLEITQVSDYLNSKYGIY